MLGANPLKSRILARRLAVARRLTAVAEAEVRDSNILQGPNRETPTPAIMLNKSKLDVLNVNTY